MATLNFTLALDGLEADTFIVREYEGHESLSNTTLKDGSPCYGFRYKVSLASRDFDLTADQVVDKSALLTVYRNGEAVQQVHGIVRHFEKGDTGHNHTYYALSLVPAFERLSLRHNSRIFQKKTAQEILELLLGEMAITEYAFNPQREPAQREFCVQYRETDLDFFHRLAAEEGWVYYFSHEADKHVLNVVDKSQSMPVHGESIPYNSLPSGVDEAPYISTLTQHTQSFPSKSILKDYSFKKPEYQFLMEQEGSNMTYQQGYEYFDAPGRFKDDANGTAFANIRLEYLRRMAHTATGKSNNAAIRAGIKVTVENILQAEQSQEWLPVYVTHKGTQHQALEENGDSGITSYDNEFTLIPSTVNWQATPQTKPSVDGPMMATVVGPAGEEIDCDEFGRVKIHFPWDRESNKDEHSSCFVRVSQGWAGNQYGSIAIPRIGTDVIVNFLNSDPDQPIITGRTYNANNLPAYTLPEHKTKSVWRSDTHQGEGFNEISFEDQVEQEQVYLHAQKDMEADILNDQIIQISNDQHTIVTNDRFMELQNDNHLTIEGESHTNVLNHKSVVMDASFQQEIGTTATMEAGEETHLKTSGKVVMEAATELFIAVGSNAITIHSAGIDIGANFLNLNAGGTAGVGTPFEAEAPMLALGVESPLAPEQIEVIEYTAIISAQQPTLVMAAEAGLPICEECVAAANAG